MHHGDDVPDDNDNIMIIEAKPHFHKLSFSNHEDIDLSKVHFILSYKTHLYKVVVNKDDFMFFNINYIKNMSEDNEHRLVLQLENIYESCESEVYELIKTIEEEILNDYWKRNNGGDDDKDDSPTIYDPSGKNLVLT